MMATNHSREIYCDVEIACSSDGLILALRAQVIAAGTVLFMVVGAISPPLVGLISDDMAANPRGLMLAAVGVAVAGFVACAALARFMEGPYRRTVAALEDA